MQCKLFELLIKKFVKVLPEVPFLFLWYQTRGLAREFIEIGAQEVLDEDEWGRELKIKVELQGS